MFATESAIKALAFQLEQLHLLGIVESVHVENNTSLKVHCKIGMKYVHSKIIADCPVETYEAFNPKS